MHGQNPGRAAPLLSLGLRYMVTGAFFFSIMSLLVKLAGQRPAQPGDRAGPLARHGVLAWATLRVGHSHARDAPPSAVLRGLLGFGALSCFYYALVHLPLADATVLQYTNPAFAACSPCLRWARPCAAAKWRPWH
jgi:drug/metabolite transporter (DMT)-like permease